MTLCARAAMAAVILAAWLAPARSRPEDVPFAKHAIDAGASETAAFTPASTAADASTSYPAGIGSRRPARAGGAEVRGQDAGEAPGAGQEQPFAELPAGKGEDMPDLKGFARCVLTRKKASADVETARRATSLCHLVSICRLLGRELKWDPKAENFPGGEEANRMRTSPRRKGYGLPRI